MLSSFIVPPFVAGSDNTSAPLDAIGDLARYSGAYQAIDPLIPSCACKVVLTSSYLGELYQYRVYKRTFCKSTLPRGRVDRSTVKRVDLTVDTDNSKLSRATTKADSRARHTLPLPTQRRLS